MKHIGFLLAVLVGCGANNNQAHTQAPTPAQVNDASKFEEIIRDDTTLLNEAQVKEGKAYQASIDRIKERMVKEYLELRDCVDARDQKLSACSEVKNRVCEVSMLIDSRSNHWEKRYCSEIFWAEHYKYYK